MSELGRGRCGRVYRCQTEAGVVARKRFVGQSIGTLVNTVLTGAPVAYRWCPEAVEAAALRRQVLAPLLRYWFGDRLTIAQARDHRWHEPTQAYELDIDFVRGRNPALCQPFVDAEQMGEVVELWRGLMPEVQGHLRASGFVGMLWQAGFGNPVALGNFMRRIEASPAAASDGTGGEGEAREGDVDGRQPLSATDAGCEPWVWIDTESGVPALFPMNPLKLLTFYLPQAWRLGQLMFDDVDVPTLQGYLEQQDQSLRATLSDGAVDQLRADAHRLGEAQRAWKSKGRTQRSIEYQRSRGRLSAEQAEHYQKHWLRWQLWLLAYASGAVARKAVGLLGRGLRWLASGRVLHPVRRLVAFTFKPTARTHAARAYAARRILAWRGRRQITPEQAERLHAVVQEDQTTSTCLSDFAVHLAMKPVVKVINWVVVPTLLLTGLVSPMTAAAIIIFGGAIGRTLYTLARMVTATWRGKDRPWTALALGVLPSVGNFAFIAELLVRGIGRQDQLAQLLIYDAASQLAHRVPIWGGPDTGVEHVLNRVADRVIHPLGRNATAVAEDAGDAAGKTEAHEAAVVSSVDAEARDDVGSGDESRLAEAELR